MTAIKICGITKEQEINYINELKPEYIGFVFTESKRKVDIEIANKLIENLDKSILTVGVFRNNSIEEVLEIYDNVSLDIIQLHGEEDEQYIEILKKYIDKNTKFWKAISIDHKISDKDIENKYRVDRLLLDSITPGVGVTFNWDNIRKIKLPQNIVFAGGVNEENVLEIINKFKPSIIDVSSGVEIVSKLGIRIKSYEKMKNLMQKVRGNYER